MGLLSAVGGIAGSFLGGPIGGMIGSTLGGAIEGEEATSEAAGIQAASAQAGIAEQRRQFDEVRKLLQPYVEAGTPALAGQQALIGLKGPQEQQAAITSLESSPLFQGLVQQGEEAILQKASATGGLRGGNVQAVLAQFRPQMLTELINQQYERLGGLTTLGQRSAAGVGDVGSQTAANVSNLLQQEGAARAGGVLGGTQLSSAIPGIFGTIQGAGGFGKVFGGSGGLNIGTALNYGTNIGSQQTAMLAAQEAGF